MGITPRHTVATALVRDLVSHLVQLPSFKDGTPEKRELGGIVLRQLLLDLRDRGFVRSESEFAACMGMIASFEPLKIS